VWLCRALRGLGPDLPATYCNMPGGGCVLSRPANETPDCFCSNSKTLGQIVANDNCIPRDWPFRVPWFSVIGPKLVRSFEVPEVSGLAPPLPSPSAVPVRARRGSWERAPGVQIIVFFLFGRSLRSALAMAANRGPCDRDAQVAREMHFRSSGEGGCVLCGSVSKGKSKQGHGRGSDWFSLRWILHPESRTPSYCTIRACASP
jgi:hypothetical protein